LTCILEGEDASLGFQYTSNGTLDVERFSQLAAVQNIFAAGDLHTGRSTVISAVAGGRMSARSIHFLLTAGSIPQPIDLAKKVNPKSILKNVSVSRPQKKIVIPEIPLELRRGSFVEEVIQTLSTKQALAESSRCLQCGTYCYNKPISPQSNGSCRSGDSTPAVTRC